MLEQTKIALKSPLTYALIVIASVASYFVTAYNKRSDDAIENLVKDIDMKQKRIVELEEMLDDYTKFVLFQNVKIQHREQIIDSLKFNIEANEDEK